MRFLIILLMLLSQACNLSKEDKEQNQIINIQEAINVEDYDTAINLLKSMPNNDETVKLKAIAFAGRAGFNALKIADLIYEKEGQSPLVVLYELAEKYHKTNSIDDLNQAVLIINEYYKDKNKNRNISAIYGLIQTYKVAQIIFKNVKNQTVNGCDVIQIATEDVFEIAISINSAIISLENYILFIKNFMNNLREDLKIKEDMSIELEINNVKNELQNLIYEQIQDCGN